MRPSSVIGLTKCLPPPPSTILTEAKGELEVHASQGLNVVCVCVGGGGGGLPHGQRAGHVKGVEDRAPA